jgi:hypothetical protein
MEIPHQPSRQAIEEFKTIYLEEFGRVLSNDEAEEMALRLLRFLETLKSFDAGTAEGASIRNAPH